MLNKLLQKNIYDSLKLTAPPNYKIVMWGIWFLFAFVFFEVLLDKRIFSTGNSTAVYYFLGIVLPTLAFEDYTFFKRGMESKGKICIYTYLYNFIWMIPGVILTDITWNSFGFEPLVRGCVAFFYWVLSIPLTLINNIKWWVIGAVGICLNSILYLMLLENLTKTYNVFSNVHLLFSIGICLVATIISIMIFNYRINVIFDSR